MRTTLNIEDSLIDKAAKLTGITEKTSLVRLGLEALIAAESAKRLANDQCNRMSEYFIEKLGKLRDKFPTLIANIRGLGLLIGMELTRECSPIVNECLEMGVLINCTAEKVLRFIPPLIVQKKDIDQLVNVLEKVLGKLTA